jgi:hypothetical protein
VIISLRDGRKGRPHYPKLYRHAIADRSDMHQLANYGFPMNSKTRPLDHQPARAGDPRAHDPGDAAHADGAAHLRPAEDIAEPPRAQDGSNDDRVMAFGIALEMYRQYGTHEKRVKRSAANKKAKPHKYPWEKRRVA